MDDKNEKKKESIDDILSDLNGLLNKMPSILDGIKMPEIKPVEFKKTEPAPEPGPEPVENAGTEPEPAAQNVSPAAPAPFDGDKTVVLSDFSGLAEGASAPGEQPPPAAAFSLSDVDFSGQREESAPAAEKNDSFDGEKTVVISSLSGLPEGAPAPGQGSEELAAQSLGDFMFGESAQSPDAEAAPPAGSAKLEGSPLEPPSARIKIEGREDAPLELKPLPKAGDAPAGGLEEASLVNPDQEEELVFSSPEDIFSEKSEKQENLSSLPVAGLARASDSFADFSIPDIDALLQLSEGKPAAGPEPVSPAQDSLPEPAPLTPAAAPEPSMDDLADFEKQMTAALPREADLPSGASADGSPEGPAFQEAPEPEQPGQAEAGPQDFAAFTIEPPAPETAGEASAQAEASGPELLPEAVANGLELPAFTAGENPSAAPEQEAGSAPEPEFGSFDLAAEVRESPDAASSAEGAIQLEPAVEVFAGADELSASPVPENPAAEETMEFLPGAAAAQPESSPESLLTVGNPADGPLSLPDGPLSSPDGPLSASGGNPSSQDEGDKTMVAGATASEGGDAEKTVVMQAFASPGITSRAKMSDLGDLSKKGVPEGIPEERVRSLYFLYSSEGGTLCANLLAEIDAVCLRSQASPMFIKRAGVKVFDPDLNANYVLQTVTDSGAAGLVCVDGIPQEKIYELENAFTSSGVYFKHFDQEGFSHSAVLDMLLEVIVR